MGRGPSVLVECKNKYLYSEETRLTGDEKHDSGCKGAIKPFKGGEVSEGHDRGDDAREA